MKTPETHPNCGHAAGGCSVDVSGDGLLERTVRLAHRIKVGNYPAHPYFLMADLAVASVVSLALAFAVFVEGFSLLRFAIAYPVTVAAYRLLYMRLKKALIGEVARSFLQDTMVFVLPTWLGLSWLVGLNVAHAGDFAALSLSLVLGFMRMGCFVGGCCYGIPASWGVRYSRDLWLTVKTWRFFMPGPFPEGRVVPIQLISAGVSFLLFTVLGARMIALGGPDGRALPLYLLGYGLYRFVAERYRGHRHRPMWGPLSEAQWTSLIVVALALTVLGVW